MTADTAARAGFLHPSRPIFRFITLGFIASLSFGSYFAYDIIGAIAPSLVSELKAARATVGTMNTMYSIAAILVVLFGGMLIDRLGTRKASLIFSVLVLAGAVIVWQAKSIPLIFLGRFVFGAGSEPLVVAQSAMLARWFKNKELAMAFGIQLTVSRLGSLFAFNTGELFSSYFGSYRYALMAAAGACALSLIGNVFYIFMDRRGEKALNLRDESAGEKIVFRDIKEFRPTFWYVTFLCLTFYAAVFPFQSLSTDFFATKWGIALTAPSTGGFLARVFSNLLHIFSTAGGISSIIIFASMILAPFAGRLVDKVGRRATFMIAGSLLMIPCHLAMGLTAHLPRLPDDPSRVRLRARAGGDVAVGAAHRPVGAGGDRLRADDGHPEHRPRALSASQRIAPRRDRRLRGQPGHVRQPGPRRAGLRPSPQTCRPARGQRARGAEQGRSLILPQRRGTL